MSRFPLIILVTFLLALILLVTYGTGRRPENSIVIWTQDLTAGRAVLDSVLQAYMEEHPDVSITLTYYETEELRSNFIIAALGGSGPDLIYGPADAVGPFHVMGIIQPLETLLDAEYLEQFDPKARVWYKGHLYLLGDRIGNHLALVYNKRLVPNPPKTSDELIEMGRKLSRDTNGDGLIDDYALAWNFVEPFFFVPFLGGFGGWVMDEEGNPTLNTRATVEACKFILRLREEKIIPRECDLDLANQLFKQENAAMVINGPWAWGSYIESGIDMGLARIPKISETGLWPTPMVSAKGYSININTRGERLKRTVELMKYLLTPEVQLAFTHKLKTIPSHKEARQNPIFTTDEILIASLNQLEVGRPMPVDPAMRAIWDAMRPAYQMVLNGTLSPEEAAEKMQKDAERLIRDMLQ